MALYQISDLYQSLPSRVGHRITRNKDGMDDLVRIIQRYKKDIKRVSKAISPQGAQEIVNKHNQDSPNNPWTLIAIYLLALRNPDSLRASLDGN